MKKSKFDWTGLLVGFGGAVVGDIFVHLVGLKFWSVAGQAVFFGVLLGVAALVWLLSRKRDRRR